MNFIDRRDAHFEPGKLWSLWDMLRAYAAQLSITAIAMERLAQAVKPKGFISAFPQIPTFGSLTDPKPPANDTDTTRELVEIFLDALPGMMHGMPMPGVSAQIDRMKTDLRLFKGKPPNLPDQVAELLRRFEDDLKSHKFFLVNQLDQGYYEDAEGFGPLVAATFPKSADDIEAAGKCLALRQGTATVFHLMRVMEDGFKPLAASLGIPYAPSWEGYIKQITAKIEAKHKTKSLLWKKNEPFYREVLGDLTALKVAFRNPTMHIVRKYDRDEAEEIYRMTKRYMNRLAEWHAEQPVKQPRQRTVKARP
jgi:hypothetical protein